jgi:hypothetical protein
LALGSHARHSARLVLTCADGAANTARTRRYRTTDATFGKWRLRFYPVAA